MSLTLKRLFSFGALGHTCPVRILSITNLTYITLMSYFRYQKHRAIDIRLKSFDTGNILTSSTILSITKWVFFILGSAVQNLSNKLRLYQQRCKSDEKRGLTMKGGNLEMQKIVSTIGFILFFHQIQSDSNFMRKDKFSFELKLLRNFFCNDFICKGLYFFAITSMLTHVLANFYFRKLSETQTQLNSTKTYLIHLPT